VFCDCGRCFNLLAGDPTQKQEWAWELRDPRCVLRVRSYPISNVATHGRVWLFDDVTAKRDAHDAIEAADKAKSNFLAMMSHELRTPMTGVLGMLDLLLLTMLTPEQAGYVRVMQGSAEGLMQVLNEILDFSKIQSGHLALDIVDFHIGEVLDQVHLETPLCCFYNITVLCSIWQVSLLSFVEQFQIAKV
jgi:signal transduction histidine kinase